MVLCLWKDCYLEVDNILKHLNAHLSYATLHSRNSADNLVECQWQKCHAIKMEKEALLSHVVGHLATSWTCGCGRTFKQKQAHNLHIEKCKTALFEIVVNELFYGIPDSPNAKQTLS